jgi:hypothetical protein
MANGNEMVVRLVAGGGRARTFYIVYDPDGYNYTVRANVPTVGEAECFSHGDACKHAAAVRDFLSLRAGQRARKALKKPKKN